jgi:uncharacterized membrane protein
MGIVSKRFLEIDIIKGIAVTFMVIFHFFFLSRYMDVYPYIINQGMLYYFAKIAHYIFIFIVGVNLSIINQKYIKSKEVRKVKQFKRGIFLLGGGMIISVLSYIAFGDLYVKFGILHFLGVSIIISQFIIDSNILVGTIGISVILLYFLLQSFPNNFFNTCWKFPMLCFISGIKNIKYSSLDHFSIIPYFSLICLGILLGDSIYSKGIKRKDKLVDEVIDKIDKNILVKTIATLGKYSLQIYFIHILIIYFILFVYKKY